MVSSLRNFFITFVIALLVFGGLAFLFYPKLAALLPTAEAEEEGSDEESGDASGEVSAESTESGIIDVSDPDSSDKGSLGGLLLYKNDEGTVIGVRYVRYNLDREAVAFCDIPVSTTLYNDVGASVPLSDLFGMVEGKRAAEMIPALTGCRADFFVSLSPDSLPDMIAGMSAPYFTLKTEIDYVNPKYEGIEYPIGSPLPSDYKRHVSAGRVSLTKDTLEIILEYYRTFGGADGVESADSVLNSLYKALMTQLVTEQRFALSSDHAKLLKLFRGGETDLNEEFLREHGSEVLGYNDFEETVIAFSSRTTVKAFKDFDR